MKFLQTFCVVDGLARLLWVGGDWDDFARGNGGESIAADGALSTSLLQHIADERTAAAVMTIIDRVLSRQARFHLHYRCDSPSYKRDLLMTVSPMKDQRLLFTHDLLDAQAMPHQQEGWGFSSTATDQKCSFCCSVLRPGGTWEDPYWSDLPHPPTVRYTICPACEGRLQTALSDMVEAQPADLPGGR